MENREAIKIIKGLIASVERVYKSNPLTEKEPHPVTDALILAISALEQQGDLKWTRTSDDLPDPWEYVWVTDRGGRLAVCQMSHKNGDWYDEDDEWLYDHDSIVAWMPYTMPEPYKEDGKDGD